MSAKTDTPAKRLSRPGPGEAGREAVLAAAADEFVKHGFNATSMDGIADALGSTKGRVYHYYRGKAEIFLDVVQHGMEGLLEVIEPIAADVTKLASQRLANMVRSHALLMMEASNPQRVAVQLVQYRSMPELAAHQQTAESIIALRRRYEQAFVNVLKDGITDGTFIDADPSLAAKSMLGALNWIPMWFRPGRSSAEEVARIAEFFSYSILRSLEAERN